MRDTRQPRQVAVPLTDDQAAGTACVWCCRPLMPLSRRYVGVYGLPARKVYACQQCATAYRVPTWPEYGSA